MEERKIDFTDEEIFNNENIRSYYVINETSKKEILDIQIVKDREVIIKIKTVQDDPINRENIFYCKYNYIKFENIHEKIVREKTINLRGYYIDTSSQYTGRINPPIDMELVDCSFSFWSGEVEFGPFTIKGGINFQYAYIKGSLGFDRSIVKGDINFDGFYVSSKLDFISIAVEGNVYITGAFVKDDLYLGGGRINGDINLAGTVVERDVVLSGSKVWGEVRLSLKMNIKRKKPDRYWPGARFLKPTIIARDLVFDSAEISGQISLSSLVLGNNLQCIGASAGDYIVMKSCKIGGSVNLAQSSIKSIEIILTRIDDGIGLCRTKVKDSILIDTATIKNSISFYHCSCREISIEHVVFIGKSDLRFDKADSVNLYDCTIEKAIRLDGNAKYEKLSLKDTINLGYIYIDWEENNVKQAIERYSFNKKGIRNHNQLRVEQFQMLKENYRSLGRYDEEDAAYRAYMKYKRLSIKNNIISYRKSTKRFKHLKFIKKQIKLVKYADDKLCKKIEKNKKHKYKIHNRIKQSFRHGFYVMFGHVGGYGTKPWTIAPWMGAVIVLFGALQTCFPLNYTCDPIDLTVWERFWSSVYFSTITFLTIGYGDVSPITVFPKILAGLEGFLGLFLMSYFTVAIVRKLLR